MKYEGTISDNKDLVTKQYVDNQDTTKEAVTNKVTSFFCYT